MGFKSPNYTQIPNDLFDMIPDMGHAELALVMVLCRETFGFHRSKKRIALREMAERTGLTVNSVQAGAEQAEAHGLFRKVNDGGVTLWELIVEDDGVSPTDTKSGRGVSASDTAVSASDTPSKKESIKQKSKESAPASRPAAPAVPAQESHHVSLVAFREVRGRWPARECWQQIIETVGDAPAALQLWRDVLTAWSAAGYSPTRIDGPLDWFRAGGAPNRKPAGQQQRPTSSQRAHSARTAAHASYNDYWDAKMQARGLPLVEAPRVPQPSPDSPWYDQTAQEAVTA